MCGIFADLNLNPGSVETVNPFPPAIHPLVIPSHDLSPHAECTMVAWFRSIRGKSELHKMTFHVIKLFTYTALFSS